MGILKYHQTSLISYERGWPLACLEDLIKPNQASHQGARWTSSVSIKVPVLALIIESSAVWPWCRRSFQDICRGLWIIIAELTCGLFPMIFRMVFLAYFPWSFAWCSSHAAHAVNAGDPGDRDLTDILEKTLPNLNPGVAPYIQYESILSRKMSRGSFVPMVLILYSEFDCDCCMFLVSHCTCVLKI
jgi:hypothetical protein